MTMSKTIRPERLPRPPRLQCRKCPWRKDVDPNDIPGGYSRKKHAALACTIARPGDLPSGPLRLMACHETPRGHELPCVGWMVHQLGPGQNLGLRMAVSMGKYDGNVETVGDQHACLEDTLPRR